MLSFLNNLDWMTFFIALAFFIVIVNFYNYLKALYLRKLARRNLKVSEGKLQTLKQILRSKQEKLSDIIKRGDIK